MTTHASGTPVPRSERPLLWTLAAVQLTVVLDFLVVMPLGPQYRRTMHITPQQFGVIVAAYAVSAGISGIFMGLLLDRFDRRKALLFLFTGFLAGTLACALAPSYETLVAARVATGICGGVLCALVYAIIGDAVPEERRGAAMGLVMSAFSLAAIIGVPVGVEMAEQFSWHAPFFGIAGLGLLVLPLIIWAVPPMRGHLVHAKEHHPLRRWWLVMSHPTHLRAFAFMATVVFAGFVLLPFMASHMTANIRLAPKTQLPWVYVCGGVCTLFATNLVGRWSDRIGKPKAFALASLASVPPTLALTHLPAMPMISEYLPQWLREAAPIAAPLAVVLATTSVFIGCMSSRMGPAMAMMTASVEPRLRGGFLSMNASVQQLAMGVAAWGGAQLLMPADPANPTSRLLGFDTLSTLSIACLMAAVALALSFRKPTSGMSAPSARARMAAEAQVH